MNAVLHGEKDCIFWGEAARQMAAPPRVSRFPNDGVTKARAEDLFNVLKMVLKMPFRIAVGRFLIRSILSSFLITLRNQSHKLSRLLERKMLDTFDGTKSLPLVPSPPIKSLLTISGGPRVDVADRR